MSSSYRQIADKIGRELDDTAAYPPGTRLPSVPQLMAIHSAGRNTIKAALAVLKRQGRLISATSQGHQVAYPPVQIPVSRYGQVLDPHRVRAHLGPWETALADQGLVGHGDVYDVSRTPATDHQAKALRIRPGATLVGRHRHMTIDGVGTAQIQHAWMPLNLIKNTPLASEVDIPGGVYAVMTASGIHPHRIREDIGCRITRTDEATALDMPPDTPVMELWRTTYDPAGNPVELLQVINGPMIRFVYDLPIS
jgi:GntR family transcriptional regulator